MRHRLKYALSINWLQTLTLNFKALPFKQALRLPMIVFKGFKIKEFRGKILFEVPLQFGLVGFGQRYEIFTRSTNAGEATINGTFIIRGAVQFGVDTKLYILEKAILTLGHINSFATATQIICFQEITLGDWVQFGSDCMLVDTNFHALKNKDAATNFSRDGKIKIGNHVYIGARTVIRQNTQLSDHTLVGSLSLCNKDYTPLGSAITLAGIPAQCVQKDVIRDWETEKTALEDYLKIKL